MSNIKKIILLIFLCIASFILGKNTAPDKIKIKKVETIKEVIVYKENISKKIDENLEIKEVIVEKPNGHKVTTRHISKKKKNTIIKAIASNSTTKSAKSTQITKINKRTHTISLIALNPSLNSSFNAKNLGIMYQNNLFLGITAGVAITADMVFFLSIGLNF